MSAIDEIWVDIPMFISLYQVSNKGRVKSLSKIVPHPHSKSGFCTLKEKILSTNRNQQGYEQVSLTKNNSLYTYRIHQLVAMGFLNHLPNGHLIVVDHIDNNKENNCLENIQLISNRENTSKDKNKNYTGAYYHKPTGKWTAKISINYKLKHIGTFNTEKEAGKAYQYELKKLNK